MTIRPAVTKSHTDHLAICFLIVVWPLTIGRIAKGAVDFDRAVAPILQKRCIECHNASGGAGELSLTSPDGLETGGKSGKAIEPGNPDASLLFQRIVQEEMPPEKGGKRDLLSPAELATIRDWIREGANWPQGRRLDPFELSTQSRAGRDWWSFQPIDRPSPPEPSSNESRNPIDLFVQSRLLERGWVPAPEANRRTLIRRLYFDLIGLPPTAADVEAFDRDPSPTAYEDLVDRLLASPRFGERWARFWLDVVRFAETCGYERDQEKPHAWRYRDWVVRAFNDDLPYDRFILQQLAGDELADRNQESLIATGFLRLGTWNDEPNDPQEYKYERIEDMVHATSAAFLGLTIKCARCHDHKFDPISQADYYRMATAFWAGFIEPGSGKLQGGPDATQLGFDVLGWTDASPNPAPLRLLRKGDPLRPAEIISPAHLAIIPHLNRPFIVPDSNAKTTQRRRQLAEWIIDRNNPLTARVWVNRLWQHHFGQPLVATPDNFGFAAGRPFHGSLLDWLAAELIDSNWSSKQIHRLIVTSQTYRQSSVHSDQSRLQQLDPANQYLWRAERRRLDAESLRDSVLAAAGQLDLRTIGGPSFRMDIDAGALEGLSMKGNAWKPSPVKDQYRRALYSFSKRSLLPPLLTAFDLADTTLPCGKRDVTTVAPQALALLNNSFVHVQSSHLGRWLGKFPTQQRVRLAWRLILSREPTGAESKLGEEHFAAQLAHLRHSSNPDSHSDSGSVSPLVIPAGLVMHLRADRGLELDERQGLVAWHDHSPERHTARQPLAEMRPRLSSLAWGGRPAIRFDGHRSQLRLEGQLLRSQQFTLVAVVSDQGTDGLREILSNWNGTAKNSTTSVFLGLAGNASVRFSDDFKSSGELDRRDRPFVLTAVSGTKHVAVYQNLALLGRRETPLAPRNLETAYVIGTQGNLGAEFWRGDISEILVFDRALDDLERESLVRFLQKRFGMDDHVPITIEERALASLCHVLLNSNEFLYVD